MDMVTELLCVHQKYIFTGGISINTYLQCFDAVGWSSGRAYGKHKLALKNPKCLLLGDLANLEQLCSHVGPG